MSWKAAFVLLLVNSTAQAADWPQWLGPRRDGSTPEKFASWDETSPPKVLWREKVGPAFSTPVVAAGRVFVHSRGSDMEKEEEEVLALDAATGKRLWKDTYSRPVFKSVLGTGPRATPVVAGNRLFTLGINGFLTCYDVDSGSRRWQIDLYQHFKANLPGFAVCSSPLVVGNRLIVSVGGKGCCVVGLHAETGAVQWQALDDAASTSSSILFAGGSRPRGATPDVVFMTPLRLVGLDPLDGSLRWEHPMVFQPKGTSPTPIAVGNQLIASTQAHGALAVRVESKDDKKDDKLAAVSSWQNKEMKSYFSSGVAAGALLFLVTNKVEVVPAASISCLEVKTGKLLWVRKNVGYFHAGVLSTGDGKLLVLSDGGVLSLLDVDAKGAKELAQAKVCGGTLVSPALANGRLYVRDDRELICLQLVR